MRHMARAEYWPGVSVVTAAARDPDKFVSAAATNSLRTLRPLMEVALNNPDQNVRVDATNGLMIIAPLSLQQR